MKMARNILLVDDEAQWLRALSVTLKRRVPEAHVDTCMDGRQVLERMQSKKYSLVLLDLTMPFRSGEDILQDIKLNHPNCRVIIVTGVNEIDSAVRCMKRGAYDYFNKAGEVEALVGSVRRALEVIGLEANLEQVRESFFDRELKRPDSFKEIISCEPAVLDRLRYLEVIASSPAPVLIIGESGTGKDVFAKALHQLAYPEQPFEVISLTSMSLEQLRVTLFGSVSLEGGDTPGLVQLAGSGVLYLDEIGELSMDAQSQLVELLEHNQYFPVGAQKPVCSECRIVASSSHDLKALHQQGRFRGDLLYRLNAHELALPPLRERRLDIGLLINHFIDIAAQELNRERPLQPSNLANQLWRYGFPGNLLELKGMVFDAVSRSDNYKLNISAFAEAIQSGANNRQQQLSISFGEQLPTLAEANKALVDEAMSRTASNQTAAARLLGISQSALSRRLTKE